MHRDLTPITPGIKVSGYDLGHNITGAPTGSFAGTGKINQVRLAGQRDRKLFNDGKKAVQISPGKGQLADAAQGVRFDNRAHDAFLIEALGLRP